MNALLFRILAKLWAFNFGHPCPSLVKGEVLSPEKIRATTGGIVTPPIATPPTLPNPYYPSKIANTLASLVKGRWIDGKAQTVALLRFNCDIHALFITKPFCRQDGGIASPLRFAPHSYRPLSKVRCCRPKKFGRLPEGLSH